MFCRADRRPATEILSQGMIGLKVEPVLLALSVRFSHLRVRSDVSTDSSHKGSVMKLIKTTLVISALIFSTSGMAIDKTAAGAVAGAAIGAATGKDLKSTVGGAVVGAGTGAMFKNGDKGKAARKGGPVGAAVGAGAAAVTGKSVLKGAAVGAGTGALIGEATH
jgi:hypothetical protein